MEIVILQDLRAQPASSSPVILAMLCSLYGRPNVKDAELDVAGTFGFKMVQDYPGVMCQACQ